MLENGTTLLIKKPNSDLAIEVDMSLAYDAERRFNEITYVNRTTAVELASTFTRAYSSLAKAYARLCYEEQVATVTSRKRRAVILRDELPRIAKERGIASSRAPAGSQDLRESFLYEDDTYCAIEEYRAAVEATKELVYLKMYAVRMAHDSIKPIIQAERYDQAPIGATQPIREDVVAKALEQYSQGAEPVVEQHTQPTPRRSGFGKPR